MKFFHRQKGLKIFLIIFLFLVVIIYSAFDYLLERILIRDLSSMINNDPSSQYFYTFDDLDLTLADGSISIAGIGVHPKGSAFDSLKSKSNDLYALFEIQIKELQFQGLEIRKFIKTGELEMGALEIKEPDFKYYFHSKKEKVKTSISIGQLFSSNFKSAKLVELQLENGTVEIREINDHQPNIVIEGLTVRLEEAYANTQTITNFSFFEYGGIFLSAAGISMKLSDGHTIVSDQLTMNVGERSIFIKNFQVRPRLNREAFTNQFPLQKNWVALTIDTIELNGIDVDLFINHQGININKITITNPNLALYKDKTKPMPAFTKKRLPATALMKIPWSLGVDTLAVKNGLITINEKSRITGEVSNLTFNRLNANITGFTNVDSLASMLVVNASSYAMNAAKVTMGMRFDLTSEEDRFWVSGSMGSVKANAFNDVLSRGLGVKITEGEISDLSFNFGGTDSLSKGTLDIHYTNLKMEFVTTDSTKKEKRGFLSFAANAILRTQNTQGNFLPGVIHTERDQEKGFFPYVWHSIQSGLVSSMLPITNNKETKRQQREFKRSNHNKK